LKVVLTAVFVRRVFGTRFDLRTLAPLVAMTVGAFAVEYDPRFTFKHELSFYLTFVAGLSLNCMAGVQQEALFKRSMHTSIHVQNTFVYLFMLLSNVVSYVVLGAWQRDTTIVDADAPLFAGFTWIVLAICLGEAVAGLSMSYVSKVYSSISKVFASSFNMALVSVSSTVLFGTPTTLVHVCGIATITAALYFYQRDATLHSDAGGASGKNASVLPTVSGTPGTSVTFKTDTTDDDSEKHV
jgi:UDP-sugar transporter A1/2/3